MVLRIFDSFFVVDEFLGIGVLWAGSFLEELLEWKGLLGLEGSSGVIS